MKLSTETRARWAAAAASVATFVLMAVVWLFAAGRSVGASAAELGAVRDRLEQHEKRQASERAELLKRLDDLNDRETAVRVSLESLRVEIQMGRRPCSR
jgi:hypothetical protein